MNSCLGETVDKLSITIRLFVVFVFLILPLQGTFFEPKVFTILVLLTHSPLTCLASSDPRPDVDVSPDVSDVSLFIHSSTSHNGAT